MVPGFIRNSLVEVMTEAIPKLGKDIGESTANACKAAVTYIIRITLSRFLFVVFRSRRYVCSNMLLHYIIGRTEPT